MAVDVLKVTGDYKLITASNGTITLDTGNEQGTVRITGDLIVEGVSTTVNTANLDIEDNIITLNKGETGIETITLGQSGLSISRGVKPDGVTVADAATLLWDDTLTYTKPNGGAGDGIFTFKIGSEIAAIRTNHISTTGEDLVLLGSNAPNAKLSVRGTANYESGLTDDDIPNVAYVNNIFSTINIPEIRTDNTYVNTEDLNDGDPESRITGYVDNVQRLKITLREMNLGDITLDGTTIRSTNSNEELILQASGTGQVVIDDVLSIANPVSSAPTGTTDRLKIYVQPEGLGGTGLFFVNNNTRDEITSKNRSLLMSMIF